MRSLIAILFALWLAPTQAQVPMTGAGRGTPSYIGPGDINGSAKGWWGFRAFSKATAGTAAIQVCDDTEANCSDVSTNASGDLNAAGTHGSNNCDTSGTCLVKILYDQSGANSCSSAACNLTAPTGKMPIFKPGSISGLASNRACANTTGNKYWTNSVGFTQAQIYTISHVGERTGGFTTGGHVWTDVSNMNFGYNSSANQGALFAGGSNAPFTASDSQFNAIQAVYNNTNSSSYVNGSSTTGLTPSGAGIGAGFIRVFTANAIAGDVTGYGCEWGVWAGDKSANNSSMNANQRTYWGF